MRSRRSSLFQSMTRYWHSVQSIFHCAGSRRRWHPPPSKKKTKNNFRTKSTPKKPLYRHKPLYGLDGMHEQAALFVCHQENVSCAQKRIARYSGARYGPAIIVQWPELVLLYMGLCRGRRKTWMWFYPLLWSKSCSEGRDCPPDVTVVFIARSVRSRPQDPPGVCTTPGLSFSHTSNDTLHGRSGTHQDASVAPVLATCFTFLHVLLIPERNGILTIGIYVCRPPSSL